MTRPVGWRAWLSAAAILAAGCTGEQPPAAQEGPLTGVCPDPLVVQIDWHPEAEHGALYQLLRQDGHRIDSETQSVTGRLVAGQHRGGAPIDMGIDIEIRNGGEAIDFRSVPVEMHRDPEVFMGLVVTDQAIADHDRYPTIAVAALLDIDPMMIMWDPATYDVDTIAALPDDTPVSVFGPSPYLQHLVDAGVIDPEQIDPRHTGTQDRFVELGGSIAQLGFATSDPYIYEHLTDDWERPIRFELVHDTGWEVYAVALSVRSDTVDERAGCLELVVPLVQQAIIDYVSDPESTNELITDLVERFDAAISYGDGLARFAVEQQLELGIVGNGADATIGDFDLDRVQRVLDRANEIMDVPDGLRAEDLATNRFIDPEIGLPEPTG